MPQQHETGPLAILEALRSLDLDKLEEQTKNDLKGGSKSKRSEYVKRLNAIKGLRRTGVAPGELMITSVPVIPPKFRPFAQQGDTMIAGDANILYKDFIEQNDAFKQEREMFGDNNAGQGRLDLYDTAKALYGYGDPIKDKSKQKDVRGFLKKIVGRTSKQGFFQSKMIAKPMDSVGRSTIIVDPELGMDEIGLPRDLAMTMYAPHVQRRLRQSGLADTDALKHVKDMTPQALHALEKEMEVRPVVYSRAPAWYQHNIIGGNPKLIDGDAISISPAVTTGMNADFDGNCITGRSELLVRFGEIQCRSKSEDNPVVTAELDEKNVKISIDNVGEISYNGRVMKNTNIITRSSEGVIVSMPISEMPHLKGTRRLDKNGAYVYDVPAGISVLAATPDKGVRWEPVETFTEEEGCSLRKVVTSGGKSVECSSNESLAAFNPDGGLQRIKPDDAIKYIKKVDKNGVEHDVVHFAHAVPVINQYPGSMEAGDYDEALLGWLIGMFVSDGPFDGHMLTYTKADPLLRARMLIVLAKLSDNPELMCSAKTYMEMHEAETNYGIGGMSAKIHVKASVLPQWLKDLFESCYDEEVRKDTTKRSCLAKRLPGDITSYSRSKLIGVLSGFIDGDGSVSINRSEHKKNPQVQCFICTSSPYLRDSVKLLFRMLGIPFSFSVVKPKEGRVQRHDNYVMPISIEWLYRHMDKLVVATDYEGMRYLQENPPCCSAKNRAPMSYKAMKALLAAHPEASKWKAWATNLSKCKRGGYSLFARDNAQKYAGAIKKYIPDWESKPELASVVNAAFDTAVAWEYYTEVSEIPTEKVYDLGVPGAKVFMLESGLIVYDTINVHVPASDSAVAETYKKLMPSSHPYDDRSGESIKPKMKQEQVLGMYDLATRPASGTYKFKTQAEALAAVKAGDIPLDADLEIDDLKGQEKVAEFVHAPVMEEPAVDLDSPVDEQVLKAVEVMYGVKVPKVVARQFAKTRDLVGYVAGLGEMQKEAAGKIMKVWVSDMHTGSRYLRMMRFAVYMPDCAEYRGIIAGEDSKAKAGLAKKFWLNRGDNVEFEECSLEIGE